MPPSTQLTFTSLGAVRTNRSMLLVGPVHSFIRLMIVPLPKNPRWSESRRGMCLTNGSEWTDEKRMYDPLVDSVAEYQEYCEVPDMRIVEHCHDYKHAEIEKVSW